MPALSDLAKADPAYAAAFIMIAALGTIVVMPFAVPFVAPELDAGVGSIARPLLLLVLALSRRASHSDACQPGGRINAIRS